MTTHATFVGQPTGNSWGNPAAWAGGTVPTSGHHLDIRLDTSSTEDLGTASSPFLADDVIGAAAGLTYPALFMTGFLHVGEMANLGDLQVGSDAGVAVRKDLVNVKAVELHDGGTLTVDGSLRQVQAVTISFGSGMEVGHGLGHTSFTFGIGGGSVIFDDPSRHALRNLLAVGQGVSPVQIELGHIRFDQADFVPSAPGSLSGQVDLMQCGHVVYRLTDVKELAPAGVFTVGHDAKTGLDVLSYHA